MKVSLSSLVLAGIFAIGPASPSSAHEEGAGSLKIEHPWIRVAAAGASYTYAGVVEIKNDGDEPETLIGATVGRSRDPAFHIRSSKKTAISPRRSSPTVCSSNRIAASSLVRPHIKLGLPGSSNP